MAHVATSIHPGNTMSDPFSAELQAYNHAFNELELPWQWDAETFRGLLSAAGDADCVGAYIERKQAHLLRVYDKSFLRDLVLSTKARYHGDAVT